MNNRRPSTPLHMYAAKYYNESKVQTTENSDTFAIPALNYTSDKNASCSFADEMCKSSTGNLLFDAGNIDSLDHLGLMNIPRFTMRHHTHCAPPNTYMARWRAFSILGCIFLRSGRFSR